VAGVAFTADDLLGISPSRQEVLRSVTALGAAFARDELAAVATPLARKAEAEDLLRSLRVEEILAEAEVDNAVLAERYRTNPAWELTVRHLVVLSERYESDATRGEARERAAAALERVRAGESFPAVAAQVSEEPGAADRQGLLEPGRLGSWVDEFWSAANALEVGQVSPVVETPYGFHVLRLEARDTVPFPEVRRQVAAEVAALLDDLPAGIDQAPLPPGLRPTGELAGTPAPGDAQAVVAEFDGGHVEAGALRDWAATLPPPRWDAFVAGEEAAGMEALERAARAAALRARASADGVSPSPEVGEQAVAEWVRAARGWAGVLGFTPGLAGEALRDAALEALGRSGQLAELARGDIHGARPLLERHGEADGGG
jgi:NIMA-interacting peptidyl-prolyl cis-trans isomerase 1